MCGIAGIISENPSKDNIRRMLARQSHRGPDHTGVFIDKRFTVLGHNRLSIIDLSDEANQPFTDNSGRFQLTFNGEIYNYRELRAELKSTYTFKTQSDTEVLLAAYIYWGKECLNKLNGMFAFAIWDSKEKKLFAARDRFGVKPFYYSAQNNELIFGSEIKTILEFTKRSEPNEKVWSSYFCYGSYGMPNETFYKYVDQLPGGHFLEFQNKNLSIKKWYDFEKGVANSSSTKYTFAEAKEYYLDLLKDSIKLRFRADVPIGFNISGGVDSSLLLSLVNEFDQAGQISAYTFYTGDKNYDELEWAEQMIAHTKNPHHSVKFTANEVEKTAEFISNIQDEPFGGIPSLAYSQIFAQAQKDGVKVLLDGQGMDEQWAGYDYYLDDQSQNTIQGLEKSNAFRPEVLTTEFLQQAEKPQYPTLFDSDLLNKQYRDLFYTKIPRALRFNDRISMAYSTELREPFLDYRLVEFAFAQPKNYKIRNGVSKFLLRELLRSSTSQELSYTPKRVLQTPQREWLAQDLNTYVDERLEMLINSELSKWFNPAEIKKEWRNFQNGNMENSFYIWQWVNASYLATK